MREDLPFVLRIVDDILAYTAYYIRRLYRNGRGLLQAPFAIHAWGQKPIAELQPDYRYAISLLKGYSWYLDHYEQTRPPRWWARTR